MTPVCISKIRKYCLLLLAALFLCACAAGAEESSMAESSHPAQESSASYEEPLSSEDSSEPSSEDTSPEETTVEASSDESSHEESSLVESSDEPSEEPSDEPSEEPSDEPSDEPPVSSDKTVLTKQETFRVGDDGIFHYGICCSRTAFPAEINTPVIHGVDEKGEVYVFWNQQVIRLSDGTSFSHHSQVCEAQILFWGGDLYLLFTDNTVQHYDLAKGFEAAELIATHKLSDPSGYPGRLYVLGEEVFFANSRGEIYSLDGARQKALSLPHHGEVLWAGAGYAVTEHKNVFGETYCYQTLYTRYDENGTPVEQFRFSELWDGNIVPHKMPYKYGRIKYYPGWTVTVGDTVFEDAVNAVPVYGNNGEVYLVVYYPEHGEIYRITPGKEEVSFEDLEDTVKLLKDKDEVFLNISREKAKENVLEMLSVKWLVLPQHLDAGGDTHIPLYLRGMEGEEMVGIPYCRGGFNGGGYYGKESFAKVAVASIGNNMYYTTGNINPDVGHQPFTVGLDCSAFICAAWEFVDSGSGTDEPFHWSAPYHMTKYGHQVSSVYDMKEMDIFLKPGDNAHVMFFACLGPNNTVGVYEVTSLVLPEKTVFRFVDMNKLWDYLFLHPYQTYTSDGDTHQKVCDSCGYAISKAKSHTFSGGKCTSCGYEK